MGGSCERVYVVAGNGTGFYQKPYSNGAGAGGNSFMAYDDVFGGAPKFGATPFAPRAEDYSEIFGSFRSSRTSSIPMLDLPPVDDSVDAFEVVGCSSLEYTEIFGGFDFADFAASYDELFRRSEGSEESSEDAWKNHNLKLGIPEDTELIDEPHLSSVPGYTRYSSAVADDIILCEDSFRNISVETRWNKTAFINNDLNRDGKVKMVFSDSIQDAFEASQVLPDPLQPEDAVNRVAEAKNQSLSLDPDSTDGDGEWNCC